MAETIVETIFLPLKNTTFLNFLGNMGYTFVKDVHFPRKLGVLRGKYFFWAAHLFPPPKRRGSSGARVWSRHSSLDVLAETSWAEKLSLACGAFLALLQETAPNRPEVGPKSAQSVFPVQKTPRPNTWPFFQGMMSALYSKRRYLPWKTRFARPKMGGLGVLRVLGAQLGVLFDHFFGWEGSLTKIDYRKNITLLPLYWREKLPRCPMVGFRHVLSS